MPAVLLHAPKPPICIMSTVNRLSSAYDAGPRLLRDVWGVTATAIVIVALRVIAKLRIRKFGPDDILMGFALCLATVGSVMMTIGVKFGFGQRVDELSTNNVSKVILFDYLTQTFGLAGGALGRSSFIVFIIGLLVSRKWHSVVFWVLVGLQLIVNSMFIIILFVQCPGHASAIWDSDKAKCWNTHVQAYYGYFQGAFNATTDLYLAAFSTATFWRLNLNLRVKLGLVALLGLGIFAMVAAIIKIVQTRVLASSDMDPTIATINYDRWLYIETYLVIITASIPCLRSILRSVKGQTPADRNTYGLGPRYVVGSITQMDDTKNPGSALERNRTIPVSQGNVSSEDLCDGNGRDDMRNSGRSRESVIIFV
ncbi:hypothetical protein N7478_003724 [Penicillium angulare]|uniref:uncharacterized protein n=1 Tax=Penicillium angulare TaxID=116970 RepID=UPI0025418F3E|nr:uncharacterized protein N7478_003724 [Penicillium angulare]KAJ5288038.1 hypothetical protein N7478_003724 [Penicillium angulare]